MIQRSTLGLAVLAACMTCGQLATAATISIDPATLIDQTVGARVSFDIKGSGFTAGSAGGGLDLKWNAAVLGIAALSDIELLFPGDNAISLEKGTLDAAAGTLTNLSTNSLNGIGDTSFTIARITFTTLAAGTSAIELDLGSFGGGASNVWTTAAGLDIGSLNFEPASLTVVAPVPLPAGLCLLPGALALLGARVRKDSATTIA